MPYNHIRQWISIIDEQNVTYSLTKCICNVRQLYNWIKKNGKCVKINHDRSGLIHYEDGTYEISKESIKQMEETDASLYEFLCHQINSNDNNKLLEKYKNKSLIELVEDNQCKIIYYYDSPSM